MAVSLEFWHFQLATWNDFQGPLENEASRHFQMFSIFTPYGGTAPLNIGGRPGPWGSGERPHGEPSDRACAWTRTLSAGEAPRYP